MPAHPPPPRAEFNLSRLSAASAGIRIGFIIAVAIFAAFTALYASAPLDRAQAQTQQVNAGLTSGLAQIASINAGEGIDVIFSAGSGGILRDTVFNISATGSALVDNNVSVTYVANGTNATARLTAIAALAATQTIQISITTPDANTEINNIFTAQPITTLQLTVTPLPAATRPIIFSVTLTPDTVVGGQNSMLTVTPSAAIPRDVVLMLAVSDTDNAITNRANLNNRAIGFNTGDTAALNYVINTRGTTRQSVARFTLTTTALNVTINNSVQNLTVTLPLVTFTVNVMASRSGNFEFDADEVIMIGIERIGTAGRAVSVRTEIDEPFPHAPFLANPTAVERAINFAASTGPLLLTNTVTLRRTVSGTEQIILDIRSNDPRAVFTSSQSVFTDSTDRLRLRIAPLPAATRPVELSVSIADVMRGQQASLRVSSAWHVPRPVTLTLTYTDPSGAVVGTPTVQLVVPLGPTGVNFRQYSVPIPTLATLAANAAVSIAIASTDPNVTLSARNVTLNVTIPPRPPDVIAPTGTPLRITISPSFVTAGQATRIVVTPPSLHAGVFTGTLVISVADGAERLFRATFPQTVTLAMDVGIAEQSVRLFTAYNIAGQQRTEITAIYSGVTLLTETLRLTIDEEFVPIQFGHFLPTTGGFSASGAALVVLAIFGALMLAAAALIFNSRKRRRAPGG